MKFVFLLVLIFSALAATSQIFMVNSENKGIRVKSECQKQYLENFQNSRKHKSKYDVMVADSGTAYNTYSMLVSDSNSLFNCAVDSIFCDTEFNSYFGDVSSLNNVRKFSEKWVIGTIYILDTQIEKYQAVIIFKNNDMEVRYIKDYRSVSLPSNTLALFKYEDEMLTKTLYATETK